MGVQFRDRSGALLLELPISFRMEGEDQPQTSTGIIVPGRDGQVPDEPRLEPRSLTVSGVLVEDSAQAADDTFRSWAGILSGRALRLYPSAESQRYINVRYRRLSRSFVEHSGGMLARVQIELQADDPYWLGPTETYQFDATASGQTTTIHYPGTRQVAPLITIYGQTVGGINTVNPRLENLTTGEVVELALSLSLGQGARIYPIYDRVGVDRGNIVPVPVITFLGMVEQYQGWGGELESPVGVLGSVNDEWLASGFFLVPGDNVIRYTDDAASCHQAIIVFEWIPAWP